MVRMILAVIVGVVVAGIATFLVQNIGLVISPLPDGIDPTDPEQLAEIMDQIPLINKVFVVASWCIGALVGGLVAVMIAQGRMAAAWIVGLIQVAFVVLNFFMIAHPMWMMAAGPLLTLVGAGIGGSLVRAR